MGLLDDAIREHLELKRRRGADPGEVAREQREALEPVPRERAAREDDGGLVDELAPAEGPLADAEVAPVDGQPVAQDAVAPASPTADAGAGETAELDMRTVLDEHGDAASDAAPGVTAGGAAKSTTAGPLPEEESLEWEVPGDEAGDGVPQARAAADLDGQPGDIEEADEDVLEETPEFLRDTPEQDRLWFEQRPPRDFDFDK